MKNADNIVNDKPIIVSQGIKLYLIVSLICLSTAYAFTFVNEHDKTSQYTAFIMIICVLVICAFLLFIGFLVCPYSKEVSDKEIVIRSIVHKRVIPFYDITEIKKDKHEKLRRDILMFRLRNGKKIQFESSEKNYRQLVDWLNKKGYNIL